MSSTIDLSPYLKILKESDISTKFSIVLRASEASLIREMVGALEDTLGNLTNSTLESWFKNVNSSGCSLQELNIALESHFSIEYAPYSPHLDQMTIANKVIFLLVTINLQGINLKKYEFE